MGTRGRLSDAKTSQTLLRLGLNREVQASVKPPLKLLKHSPEATASRKSSLLPLSSERFRTHLFLVLNEHLTLHAVVTYKCEWLGLGSDR